MSDWVSDCLSEYVCMNLYVCNYACVYVSIHTDQHAYIPTETDRQTGKQTDRHRRLHACTPAGRRTTRQTDSQDGTSHYIKYIQYIQYMQCINTTYIHIYLPLYITCKLAILLAHPRFTSFTWQHASVLSCLGSDIRTYIHTYLLTCVLMYSLTWLDAVTCLLEHLPTYIPTFLL